MIFFHSIKFFSFIFVLFFIIPFFASAEKITNFDIDMVLKESGVLQITETISYDFEEKYRHGIFRIIPEKFKPEGALGKTEIKLISVTDIYGSEYLYDEEWSSGEFRVKIGDPNKTITGEHIYKIIYDVKNPVGFFENFDELYWNAIGDRWEVPIHNVTASIDLPKGIKIKNLSHYCGNFGEKKACGNYAKQPGGFNFYLVQSPLLPGEFLTFDIEFEKGLIIPPTQLEKNLQYLKDFWFVLVPFLFLWKFLPKRYREYKKYKEFKQSYPVGVEYDPGDITLYEASYFHDTKFELSNLGALAVWFAIHGFVKIKEVDKKTYSFTVIADEQKISTLSATKQEILKLLEEVSPIGERSDAEGLRSVFNGKITQFISRAKLKRELYTKNLELMKEVEEALVDKRYIVRDGKEKTTTVGSLRKPKIMINNQPVPKGFGRSYAFIFFFLAVNPGAFFFLFSFWLMGSPALGVIFSGTMVLFGIIVFVFPKRPNFTQEGLMAERYIAGLYKYIDMAEKDRMNVLNQFSATPELYEKLLPFAMIFGLEKKWSKTFEGVLGQNPEWFDSDVRTSFSPAVFGSSMQALGNTIGNSGAPSSSGGGSGGSSGGGGGGGGGGSW